MWDLGVGVAVAVVLAAGPSAPQLPDLREPAGEPCAVPVSGGLTSCPDPGRRPPVSCVLPAELPPGTVATPACPPYDPTPPSRVVPLLSATR